MGHLYFLELVNNELIAFSCFDAERIEIMKDTEFIVYTKSYKSLNVLYIYLIAHERRINGGLGLKPF